MVMVVISWPRSVSSMHGSVHFRLVATPARVYLNNSHRYKDKRPFACLDRILRLALLICVGVVSNTEGKGKVFVCRLLLSASVSSFSGTFFFFPTLAGINDTTHKNKNTR